MHFTVLLKSMTNYGVYRHREHYIVPIYYGNNFHRDAISPVSADAPSPLRPAPQSPRGGSKTRETGPRQLPVVPRKHSAEDC